MKSLHHSFDIHLATQYGVDGAIMIHHFQHWISVNMRLKRGKKQGRTWTYQSQQEIAAHFPYYTQKQVRRIIDNLVDDSVLIKGNFNKQGYDRTSWYAFHDESYFLTSPLICPNGQMDLTEQANGNAQMGEPIPDTKTNTRTDAEKVNDPLPPKLEPEKLPHTVPDPVGGRSVTSKNSVESRCFSSPEENVSAIAKKFKLDDQQTETFLWLANLGIDSSLETLSWWSRSVSLPKLESYFLCAQKKNPKSIGAYIAKLIQKEAIVATEETAQAGKFVKEYLESNGIFNYKISEKYALLTYPDGSQKDIALWLPSETIKLQLDVYLDHCENYR